MNFASSGYGLMLKSLGSFGKSLAGYRADIADIRQQRAMAESETEAAAYDETQSIRQSRLLLGRMRANFAAGGVSTTSGTPLLMQIYSARQAAWNAMQIRRGGEMRALRYRTTRIDPLAPLSEGLAEQTSILSQWLTR